MPRPLSALVMLATGTIPPSVGESVNELEPAPVLRQHVSLFDQERGLPASCPRLRPAGNRESVPQEPEVRPRLVIKVHHA